MQWRVGARASRWVVALGVLAIAADFAAWCINRHDRATLTALHDDMTFAELQARYGWPLWTVCKNRELQQMANGLRFDSTPLVGRCMNPTLVGGATATADELPWIMEPWSAPQVSLFRTGWVTGILVYPGEDGRAKCILQARPSGPAALLGN